MLHFLFVNNSILIFSVYAEAVNNSSTIADLTSALTRSVGFEYGHDGTHTTCGMTAEM